uniref:Uncharacterized protein n=1 Tax=Ascaris lumbricoides TaxID=6252 RepID=A0A0M3I2E0_ASCLU
MHSKFGGRCSAASEGPCQCSPLAVSFEALENGLGFHLPTTMFSAPISINKTPDIHALRNTCIVDSSAVVCDALHGELQMVCGTVPLLAAGDIFESILCKTAQVLNLRSC